MKGYNSPEFRFSALQAAWRTCFTLGSSPSGIGELPLLIEVFFCTVAKASLVQYLKAGAPNTALNQYLCWALQPNKNGVQVGTWVKIIREVVSSLRSDLSATNTRKLVLQELVRWDLGVESDTDHPVNRLVAFRSSFAHGAMVFPPDDELDELRGLLGGLAQGLSFLHAEMTENPRGCPVLVTAAGRLPLYPLFAFDHDSAVERKLSMFDDPRLGAMWHRYEAEMVGDFTEHLAEIRATFPSFPKYTIDVDVRQFLLQALVERRGIVQVIGRPQTGKSALVANIDAYVPGAVGIRVEPGMFTQNTISLSRFLLCLLGEKVSAKETAEDKLTAAVARAAAKEGAPVTVALDDAHFGLDSHPGSRTSLAQAIRIWLPADGRHTRLTLILVSAKGHHIGLPGSMVHDLADSASYLTRRTGFALKVIRDAGARSVMAQQVLGILKRVSVPLTVFEIATRLERRRRDRVFTPEVEHCLHGTLVDILDHKDGKYGLWACLNTSSNTRALQKEVACD